VADDQQLPLITSVHLSPEISNNTLEMKSDTVWMAARRTAPFVGIKPSKDAKIRFKDQIFDISSRIFAAFSARFADQLRTTELTEFVIDEDVSSASVSEFIKAC
jgi:hypothetical protein